MKNVAVILANGFEEIEAITIIDVLRRAGINTSIVALDEAQVTGAHGIKVESDTEWENAQIHNWDMIVLPGGQPGSNNLRNSKKLQILLQKQLKLDKEIAAICAAPIALAAADVIQGRNVTCYPGFEDQLGDGCFKTDRVVRDGKLTTSRGPGTALEFSLNLVETLIGSSKRKELELGMLYSN